MKTIDVWRIVNLTNAARRLRIDPNTMRQWAFRYEDFPKPFLKVGPTPLYDHLAIAEWVKKNAPYGYVPIKESTRDQLRRKAAELHRDRLGWFLPREEESA